jgi:ribosomal protein S18 acetylase RimI-like enzyme
MGRLAVALTARNRRFGELLLQNAVKRLLAAQETLGVYALVVDAKDDTAAGFYRKYGFRHTAPGGLELYLPLGRG